MLSNEKTQLGRYHWCSRQKDPQLAYARGFAFLSRQDHNISQISPCQEDESCAGFLVLTSDPVPLPCHLWLFNPVHALREGTAQGQSVGGRESWNPSTGFLFPPHPANQQNNYFCWFCLPNLPSSCIGPSTETGTREENPTLIQQTTGGFIGHF